MENLKVNYSEPISVDRSIIRGRSNIFNQDGVLSVNYERILCETLLDAELFKVYRHYVVFDDSLCEHYYQVIYSDATVTFVGYYLFYKDVDNFVLNYQYDFNFSPFKPLTHVEVIAALFNKRTISEPESFLC